MKILSVSFSNLSPFTGSWTIDFTKHDFEFCSLFTVFGKNADSVSAILNAVYLALFGKTYTSSASQESLLTKGENALVACVRFRRHDAEYAARWQQTVLDNQNNVSWTLRDANGLALNPENNTDAENTIRNLLNIDCESFTKTLLLDLPQFSAFLSTTPAERSYLLEKLFDGPIHALLKNIADDIYKQKRTAAEVSRKMVEAFDLVPPIEEENLNAQLADARSRISSLKIRIAKNEAARSWLQRIETLREELQRIAKEEVTLNSDIARFDIKKPVLEKAVKAQNLADEFTQLKALREQFQQKQKEFTEGQKELTHMSERSRMSALGLQEKERLFKQAETIYAGKHALVEKIRLLSAEIARLEAEHDSKQQKLDQNNSDLKTLTDIFQQAKDSANDLKVRQQQLVKKLADLGADERLNAEIGSYQQILDTIEQLTLDIEQTNKDQRAFQKELEKNRLYLQEHESALTALKKEELILQSDISLKSRHIDKLLGNANEEDILNELGELDTRLQKIGELLSLNDSLTIQVEQQSLEKERLAKNNADLKVARVFLNNATQAVQDKKTIEESCEQLLAFQRRINELESQRKELENGKPCPLCGAIHHPYSTSTPSSDKLITKLAEVREDLSKAQEQFELAQSSYNVFKQQTDASEQTLAKYTAEIENLRNTLFAKASEIDLNGLKDKKPATWSQLIKQKLNLVTNKKDDLQERIEQAKSFQAVRDESIAKLAVIKDKIQALTAEIETAKSNIASNTMSLQDSARSEVTLSTKQDDLIKEIERIYLRYGIKGASVSSLKQQFPLLLKRRDYWLELTEEQRNIDEQININSASITDLTTKINNSKAIVTLLTNELGKIDSDLRRLIKEKTDLFGTQDPDEFEIQAAKDLAQVRIQLQEAKQTNDERLSELTSIQTQLQDWESHLRELNAVLATSNNRFAEMLRQSGFINETQFSVSRISETQQDELQKQSNELQLRLADLTKRKQEKQEEFAREMAQKLTTDSSGKIKELLESDQNTLKDIQEIERSLSEQIEHNNYSKQRYERESLEYQEKEKENNYWRRIYEQLSSATDESLSRNSAPMILEILVEFAQKTIARIYPQYTLHIEEDKPYSLFLSDPQRNNPNRYEYNFSARDKFNLCLALACAFSEMCSRDTKVDNLLLYFTTEDLTADEMNTFNLVADRLRQRGKMIGILTTSALIRQSCDHVIDILQSDNDQITLGGVGISQKLSPALN